MCKIMEVNMKKSIYLFIIVTAVFLSGCGTKDVMVDFIPTPIPTEVIPEPTSAAEATEAPTPTQKAEYLGETTDKYVKVGDFGDTLNVRPGPSTEGKVVGTLKHADKVEVIKSENGWSSILFNGIICYVKSSYLVDEQPVKATPTPSPEPTKVPTHTPTPTQHTPDTNGTGPEI